MSAWAIFVLILFVILVALLTYGLERQRQELARMRREVEAWVTADLRLKRRRTGMALRSDFEPKRWLIALVRKALSSATALSDGDGVEIEAQIEGVPGVWIRGAGWRLFVTPRTREEMRQALKRRDGRLDTPVVAGELKALTRTRPRRIRLADDPLLDLAWAEMARRLGLPVEEPGEIFVFALEGAS